MNRPLISAAEVRALAGLAAPMTGAALVNMGMSITDTVMMGWIGPTALAAGAVISDLYSIVFYFMAGILAAVSPMIAQALGAGRHAEVRRLLRQGTVTAALVAVPAAAVVAVSPELLVAIGIEADVIALGRGYAWTLAPTVGLMMFVGVWRHAFYALGRPKVYLAAIVLALPANAAADAVLMFGSGPFPALGLVGAGLASALVAFGLLIFLIVVAVSDKNMRRYRLARGRWRVDWKTQAEIFRLGLPIGLSSLGEVGVFLLSTVIIGLFGAAALAAHAITLRLAGVVYALVTGLSQAATVRVGHAVGRADEVALRRSVGSAMALGTATGLIIFASLIGAADLLPRLFLDPSAPSAPAVAAIASGLLVLLGVLNAMQGPAAPAAAALRGFKDTRTPMVFYLSGYWAIGMPTACLMAFPLGLEAAGIWFGFVVGMAGTALLLNFHLFRRWAVMAPAASAAA